jgi:D-3-phosphoglycerate dehydrogenase / 2-oxoglutarate reductase
MKKKRVIVTDYNFPSLELERRAAERCNATFEAFQCRSEEEVANAVASADVVVVQFAPLTRSALREMAPAAAVLRYGIGFDNIDVSAARELRITAGYIPDYCVEEVADHTVAMILACARKLSQLDQSVRSGKWEAIAVAGDIPPSSETTVGFLGLGRIGYAVLERLQPFGFRFLATDPAVNPSQAVRKGIKLVDRDELLADLDILSLHAPATAETRHFINSQSLRKMKPTAMVVNTARGGLIDEQALADALSEGVISGAALDVFEHEPLAETSPLRGAPNLLLSPHAAWYSSSSLARLQSLAAEDIERLLSGRPPRHTIPGSQWAQDTGTG